jgi:hypothetical protein
MSNKQQTAADILFFEIKRYNIGNNQYLINKEDLEKLELQVKEMFEQQIKDACQQGFYDGIDIAKNKKSQFISAQEYYNETFNK